MKTLKRAEFQSLKHYQSVVVLSCPEDIELRDDGEDDDVVDCSLLVRDLVTWEEFDIEVTLTSVEVCPRDTRVRQVTGYTSWSQMEFSGFICPVSGGSGMLTFFRERSIDPREYVAGKTFPDDDGFHQIINQMAKVRG